MLFIFHKSFYSLTLSYVYGYGNIIKVMASQLYFPFLTLIQNLEMCGKEIVAGFTYEN